MDIGDKSKSFWERPEGTTGMITLALLGIGGAILLSTVLPFIISLLQNTIYAAFLFTILAAIVFLVTNKKIRTIVSYMFKSIMRSMTNVFITIDPIGILKNYISDLESSLVDMDEQNAIVKGQIRALDIEINNNESKRQKSLNIAKVANEQGQKLAVTLEGRKAGRLKETNLTYQGLRTKFELLYRTLIKMYERSDFLLQDMKSEVEVKEKEYNIVKASYSAYRSAVKIVNGDKDARELFEQTMEYLAEDYGKKLGEIEHFMETSQKFVASVDIQNGIYEADALKNLETWEKDMDNILLPGPEKRELIEMSNDISHPLVFEKEKVPVAARKKSGNKYLDV